MSQVFKKRMIYITNNIFEWRIQIMLIIKYGFPIYDGIKYDITNYAARLVRGGPPRRMQETALKQLGWLPAASRPKLRLFLLLYQVVHTSSPPSLAGLLDSPAQSCQVRRSHSTNMLAVKHARTSIGSRAFSVAGPILWNALPQQMRNRELKFGSFREMAVKHLWLLRDWCAWVLYIYDILLDTIIDCEMLK
jgi:hypothetical protein